MPLTIGPVFQVPPLQVALIKELVVADPNPLGNRNFWLWVAGTTDAHSYVRNEPVPANGWTRLELQLVMTEGEVLYAAMDTAGPQQLVLTANGFLFVAD